MYCWARRTAPAGAPAPAVGATTARRRGLLGKQLATAPVELADLAPLLRRPPYSGTRPGAGARPGAGDCAGDGQALRNLAPQLAGWEG
jgi:hypothetical protein